jgi:hypothetical protein
MTDAATPSRPTGRRSRRGPLVAFAAATLGGILVVLIVLATALRDDPATVGLATSRPRVVIERRVYVTTVHESVVGAHVRVAAPPPSQSTSSTTLPPAAAPAAPVSTHTS